MIGLTVSQSQRREIQLHIQTLRSRITCGAQNRQEIAIELARLLAAFPALPQSIMPTELRMEAYFEALHGIAAWAVGEARLKVIRREVPALNPTFAPTPPEFCAVARGIIEPLRADLSRLENIAVAAEDAPTPEAHARVAEGFDSLRAELGARAATPAESVRKDEAALRARLQRNGVDPSALDAIPDRQ